MPRRHPKEDDKPTGPSPQVLAERREQRKLRRQRKSPDQGLGKGLLTSRERSLFTLDQQCLRRKLPSVSTEEKGVLRRQIDSLQRELDLDQKLKGQRSVDVLKSS